MNDINKTIENLRDIRDDFNRLEEVFDIASCFVSEHGSVICKNNSALFAIASLYIADLLSEVEAILDRCGDDFSQDGKRPASGGAE